jgi:hypothetical protein
MATKHASKAMGRLGEILTLENTPRNKQTVGKVSNYPKALVRRRAGSWAVGDEGGVQPKASLEA